MIDAEGRPEVKIGASKYGGGLTLTGASDAMHDRLEAHDSDSSLLLKLKNGQEKLLKP
jgi:hypothetical protein